MKCQACGAEMAGDARACPACGADVTAFADAAATDPLAGIVDKARAIGREAMDTDIARDAQKLAGTAVAKGRELLDSDTGKSVSKLAEDAATAGKQAMGTKLGKEMAVGAAMGAVLAIPVPFIGPIVGGALGAGIAWFRAKSRKP